MRILTPIEETILYLSKGTVTLDQGLAAIEFVRSKIAGFDSDLATLVLFNLDKCFKKRIDKKFYDNYLFLRYGSVDYQGDELCLYNNWYILFGASNDRKRTELSVPDIKETEAISELTPSMTVKKRGRRYQYRGIHNK